MTYFKSPDEEILQEFNCVVDAITNDELVELSVYDIEDRVRTMTISMPLSDLVDCTAVKIVQTGKETTYRDIEVKEICNNIILKWEIGFDPNLHSGDDGFSRFSATIRTLNEDELKEVERKRKEFAKAMDFVLG